MYEAASDAVDLLIAGKIRIDVGRASVYISGNAACLVSKGTQPTTNMINITLQKNLLII
jgi:hypothetical protein